MAFGSARQNNEERLLRLFHPNSSPAVVVSRYGESLLPISTFTSGFSAAIKVAPDASFVVTVGTTTNVSIFNYPSKTATTLGTAIRSITTTSTAAKAIAISPDLLKIAVGGGNTVITIISRTSTSQSWSAATTTTITAGGQVFSLDFGTSADYPLAVGIGTAPFIEAWYLNGSTWTKTTAFTSITGLGGGTSNHSIQTVAFSPDGTKLAVASSAAPYLKVYTKSGNTYTNSNTTTVGTARIESILWVGNDKIIVANTANNMIFVNATNYSTIVSSSIGASLRGMYLDDLSKTIYGGTNGSTLYKIKVNASITSVISTTAITGTTSSSPVSGFSEEIK